jgi:16S rRNA (uracil1498-N3)-methyltransferase
MTDRSSTAPPVDVPLAFVDDLDAPSLTDDDRHHLERVLRVPRGAPLCIADGSGRWREARLDGDVSVESEVRSVPAASPPITIAFALVKGARPELVVQKLTELGVDTIVPFVAERSVVRWDETRGTRHVERLRRVAREAAMQCRRATLPHVGAVATFADVVALPGAVAAERQGLPPSLESPTLLIGPEGGWGEHEITRFEGRVGLGELVLRAETAAIAGAALLTGLRSRLVAPIEARRT